MQNLTPCINDAATSVAPQLTLARPRKSRRSSLHPGAAAELAPDELAIIAQALTVLERHIRRAPQCLNTPGLVKQWLTLHYGVLPHEVFGIVLLDAQLRFIRHEQLFRGTLTQTSVYPREVVRCVLTHNAGAVVAVHNHPSGKCEPSHADETLTRSLKSALALVDVNLIDHMIVAGENVMSFAESGLL